MEQKRKPAHKQKHELEPTQLSWEQDREIEVSGYQIIAEAQGQKVLNYIPFGKSSGEWLLLAREPLGRYFLYTGRYGSCFNCDHLGIFFGRKSRIMLGDALRFVELYPPFLIVEPHVMRYIVEIGQLDTILPKNLRGAKHINLREAAQEFEIAVRVEEDLPVSGSMVLQVRNAELQSRILNRLGNERFLKDVDATIVARDQWGTLIRTNPVRTVVNRWNTTNDPFMFVQVKDASTKREYLLRVPPTMTRPKQAIAWTFGLDESQYNPDVQT